MDAKITVNPNGNASLYSNTFPVGSKIIGTVTRNGIDTGALVLTPAGIYCQVNAGAIRTLDQRAVKIEYDRLE